MKSDSEIIKQFEKHKKQAIRGLDYQKKQDEINESFFSGNPMMEYTGTSDRTGDSRKYVVYNRVIPMVKSVAGFMIQTRRKPSYQAVDEDEQGQQARSEYLNSISDHCRFLTNADQEETRQDMDTLKLGYGAIDTSLSYERNPEGEIRMERITDVWWDPMARQSNLLDARFIFRRKKYELEEALELFHGDEEDFEYSEGTFGRSEYLPGGGLYTQFERDYGDNDKELVNVYYYQWWEREKYYRARNPLKSNDTPLDPGVAHILMGALTILKQQRDAEAKYDDEKEDIFAFDPNADILILSKELASDVKKVFRILEVDADFVEQTRCRYYTTIHSGKVIFKKFLSPDQKGFSVKFKTGDWDEIKKCWFGMVTLMREPARYANKALTEMMFVIASLSKGGVMYETGAVPDPAKFEKQYASTRAAIEVNPGALSGGMIQPKAQAALPTGIDAIYQDAVNAHPQVLGINPEFLGSSENKQVSALLEQQRIKQVVTTLASYFDAITLYQIEQARMMLTYIRMWVEGSEGKLVRILNQQGAMQFVQLMADRLADEYELEIGEIPDTASVKEERASMMMQLSTSLLQFGVNILPVAFKYLPIKQADIQQLLELIQPPPPDPEQQQLKAVELDQHKAKAASDHATAIQKTADAGLKQAQTEKLGFDAAKVMTEMAVMARPDPKPQPTGANA